MLEAIIGIICVVGLIAYFYTPIYIKRKALMSRTIQIVKDTVMVNDKLIKENEDLRYINELYKMQIGNLLLYVKSREKTNYTTYTYSVN